MNLAGRMLLLVLVIDTFLFFGMAAVDESTIGYGNYMGQVMNMTCDPTDPTQPCANQSFAQGLVDVNNTGNLVPAETMTWNSFSAIVGSIIGFIQLIFGIATAPFTFMALINAPQFAVVLIGGIYIVMAIIGVVQLISGRLA